MKIIEPIEIYIHIPFCVKKCNYCDFLSFAAPQELKDQYVEALLQQIRMVGSGIVPGMDPDSDEEIEEHVYRVSTVYIGGGTPSTLSASQIGEILCQLKQSFDILEDAEITMEVNPGTVSFEKLTSMRECGINRLSIGLQSANEDELKKLGRIHNFEAFKSCFDDARKAGFDNISVDIMTALPDQTEEKLDRTLAEVIGLSPEHISAYSLIIEEDTPFFDEYGELDGPVVGEEAERKLYYMTRERLEKAGYLQYEISNFAKEGFESRHNTGYWKRNHYFGLGLGASSFFAKYRVTNTGALNEYIKNPCAFESCEVLSDNDAMEEFMFLGLRMMRGVNILDFNKAFGMDFEDIYGDRVKKLISDNLLEQENGILRLTKKGIDYGNHVFSQFLL